MATKVPILALPHQLRYDHEEVLAGGAQFCRFDALEQLKSYWARQRTAMRYACVGTGFMDPARFLEPHEWVFSPSKEALVAYFSSSWTPFQADRGRDFSVIVDGVSV